MHSEQSKHLKVSSQYRGSDHQGVPMIRLSGKWVAELGFNQGDLIKVTMREGLMIIERAEQKECTDQVNYKAALEEVLRKLEKMKAKWK